VNGHLFVGCSVRLTRRILYGGQDFLTRRCCNPRRPQPDLTRRRGDAEKPLINPNPILGRFGGAPRPPRLRVRRFPLSPARTAQRSDGDRLEGIQEPGVPSTEGLEEFVSVLSVCSVVNLFGLVADRPRCEHRSGPPRGLVLTEHPTTPSDRIGAMTATDRLTTVSKHLTIVIENQFSCVSRGSGV
jgi:hypothetical protein